MMVLAIPKMTLQDLLLRVVVESRSTSSRLCVEQVDVQA